jgi:hypothetical protein
VQHLTGRSYRLTLGAAILALFTTAVIAQSITSVHVPAAVPAERDGQHDFDFTIGNWKTHITRLQKPLSGSTIWIEMEGTKTEWKIWNGRAHLEEIEADGPTGHMEGLTLFLYNPQAHQWNQTFASSRDGTLGNPMTGAFKDGRAELVGLDSFNDKTILVRGTWSDITQDSHKFEQAFSEDGGKTWETNFIALLTREKSPRKSPESRH